jgi:hypothetical protein
LNFHGAARERGPERHGLVAVRAALDGHQDVDRLVRKQALHELGAHGESEWRVGLVRAIVVVTTGRCKCA